MSNRKFTPARRRSVAYHEAGHAIANHELGYDFIDVEIFDRPTENRAGLVRYDTSISTKILDAGIIATAGPLAQIRCLKRPNAVAIWLGDGSEDYASARSCAEELAQLNTPRKEWFLSKMEAHAGLIVQNRWADIERVADALLARSKLSHGEFLQALAA